MKRRKFLRTTAPIVALPFFMNGFSFRAYSRGLLTDIISRATNNTDHVLVLIQLNGGNDGLNTVIPIDQYSNLSNARANILVDEKKVLSLTGLSATGLHPSMTGMQGLYNNGKVAIVQGVSYPNPNYSHFRATDIWLTGSDANTTLSSGWMGRYLADEYPNFPTGYPNTTDPDPLAIEIGSVVSLALQGPAVSMGMSITNPSSFYSLITGQYDAVANTPAGHELAYVREVSSQTQAYAGVIKAAAGKATNLSTKYPSPTTNSLADQLKIVAQLIAGGLKTRVYMVNIGGFDTHANQVSTTGGTETGAHADLLAKVSEAINAFQDDIQLLKCDQRVLGMTFSEFGRRIKSNASLGTDHGAGAPVFLFGSQVNGGMIGKNPTIASSVSVNDNIAMQYDFRSIYTTIIKNWFGVPDSELLDVMLSNFPLLPALSTSGIAAQGAILPEEALSQNYPNPFNGTTRIGFMGDGGHVQIKVFDSMGREVQTLVDSRVMPGQHEITFEGHNLPAGTYYCRMQTNAGQIVRTMLMVK